MTDALELRPITPAFVPRALEKAEHYRLLNEPDEAESICLDVLAVAPENQGALALLVLAVTDQFVDGTVAIRRAREYLARLTDEYQKLYLSGFVAEREARAFLKRELRGEFAYDSLRQAMNLFDQAEKVAAGRQSRRGLALEQLPSHHQQAQARPPEREGELPLE